MKVIAINGSARKNWNTATLLEKALAGAASQGAATELIHLYDLNYQGCTSCFDCKRKGGASYGKCSVVDELTPVLEKLSTADALFFGSPIYFGTISGEMKSFLERLLFPFYVYDARGTVLFDRKIPVGFIYAMGAPEEFVKDLGYEQQFAVTQSFLTRIFGYAEHLSVTDTYQFDDYAKYESSLFDAAKKRQRREEQFPLDCEQAYAMGVRFASKGWDES